MAKKKIIIRYDVDDADSFIENLEHRGWYASQKVRTRLDKASPSCKMHGDDLFLATLTDRDRISSMSGHHFKQTEILSIKKITARYIASFLK